MAQDGVTNQVVELSVVDTQFWGEVMMSEGSNTMTVTASDAAGNSSSTNIIVVRDTSYVLEITNPAPYQAVASASFVVEGRASLMFSNATFEVGGVAASTSVQASDVKFIATNTVPVDQSITAVTGFAELDGKRYYFDPFRTNYEILEKKIADVVRGRGGTIVFSSVTITSSLLDTSRVYRATSENYVDTYFSLDQSTTDGVPSQPDISNRTDTVSTTVPPPDAVQVGFGSSGAVTDGIFPSWGAVSLRHNGSLTFKKRGVEGEKQVVILQLLDFEPYDPEDVKLWGESGFTYNGNAAFLVPIIVEREYTLSASSFDIPAVSERFGSYEARAAQLSFTSVINDELMPELEGYQAWRTNDTQMVSDEEEEDPGFLLTQNLDSGSDPLEAKLICKAMIGAEDAPGLKRFIRVNIENIGSGTPEIEFAASGQGPFALADGEEHEITEFPIDQDAEFEICMFNPDDWEANTYAEVEYFAKTQNGDETKSDKVRLLRPVVMAIGDSLTFGVMGEITVDPATPNPHGSWTNCNQVPAPANIQRTPPLHPVLYSMNSTNQSTWPRFEFLPATNCSFKKHHWVEYPANAEWTKLPGIHGTNGVANKAQVTHQGYRGYLADKLPGFLWVGRDTNGHGPPHFGYPGAKRSDFTFASSGNEARLDGVEVGPCYAIVLYCVGMNDAGSSLATPLQAGNWSQGFDFVLDNGRRGKGKTLAVAMKIPVPDLIASHKRLLDVNTINAAIPSLLTGGSTAQQREAAEFEYVIANTDSIPHDAIDDNIHFIEDSGAYSIMADRVFTAIVNGLEGD